jgi:hypothetical protein
MISVGDIWKRRVERFDGYDVIEVRGRVDNNGERPDEWTIGAYPDTCEHPVIQTTSSGILDFCDLIASGDPEQAEWENGLD